jgi:hypothetical protein
MRHLRAPPGPSFGYHALEIERRHPMMEDRRCHRRVTGPFDGTWDGSAGARDCRITDLSAGGCFIDAFGVQQAGTDVTITVAVAGRQFTLAGRVVYVDRVQGFGVQFTDSDMTRQLASVLDALPS